MSAQLGWSGVLLAIVSLPGFAPRVMWDLFAGFSYRTPERIRPSNQRVRVARLGAATTVNLGLVLAVAGFWPGDLAAAGRAALVNQSRGVA